jgi:hypothetical protein
MCPSESLLHIALSNKLIMATGAAQLIIESLGELVSELAMLVLRNKQAAQPAPPTLVAGVKGVEMAAEKLHKVRHTH